MIVVGAGFAGLAAADELTRASVDVDVLEARDRVGGRVFSQPFAGAVIERGAEFILPDYELMLALADRLGLALVRKGTLYGYREPRGAGTLSLAELGAAFATAAAGTPRAGESLSAALSRARIEPSAAEAVSARLEVSCTHPADDLEASVLTEGATSFGRFDTFTLAGGNDGLSRALGAALGERLRLQSPVTRIAFDRRQVRVSGPGFEDAADAVVLTVPPSVIDAITFDPPLPAAKRAALRAVTFGHAAKLFVALRTPVRPSAVLSVPERYWCYTQLDQHGEPLPVLGAFAGTARALSRLRVDSGPEHWLDSLAALRPELELDRDTVLLSQWDPDPWTRGAYSARSVRSPMQDAALAAPVGPLAFAGEHTAGEWHSLMEGALRSGVRAAHELLSGAG